MESLNILQINKDALSKHALNVNFPSNPSNLLLHNFSKGQLNSPGNDVVQSLQTQIQNELASQQLIIQQKQLANTLAPPQQITYDNLNDNSSDNEIIQPPKNIKNTLSLPKLLTPYTKISADN